MKTRIVKHGQSAAVLDAQRYFYQRCAHVPKNIAFTKDSVSYDFVRGYECNNVWWMWNRCMNVLWQDTDRDLRRADYVAYVDDLGAGVEFYHCILDEALTPVKLVHGDLTTENVIVTPSNKLCFIDPGRPHGLPCRELDEAKILMSCVGWPNGSGREVPFKVRKVHMALLQTHLIRALRYWTGEQLVWLTQKIKEIEKDASVDRHFN